MNIVSLIESYGIDVKKQGQLYVAFCPFHDDKNTPNLMIYPKTDSWYCFACNHGGDAIQFIALIEHRDRRDVEKTFIGDKIGNDVDGFNTTERKQVDFKEQALFFTANVCRDFLHKHPDKTSDMLRILKKLDERLTAVDTMFYEKDGKQLIEKFKKYIYAIGGER